MARTYRGRKLLTFVNVGIILYIAYLIYRYSYLEGFTENDASLQEIPFFIERTKQYEKPDISGTPLILYHSWHSNSVPTKMAENIYSLLKSNPEFDYYLYSDEKSAEYIRENFDEDVIYAFETLKPGAFKSDLWRYCVLYKTGGVYMDIKYNTVDSLVSLLENTPTIFVKDRDFFGNLKCVYNGVMASPPGNEIFKHCIDDIIRNCKLKLYNSTAVDVTGPCVLGRMLAKYEPDTLKNIPYTFDVNSIEVEMYDFNNKIDMIKYRGKPVLKSYPEYRSEQAQFQKTGRYAQMWMDKNIYN